MWYKISAYSYTDTHYQHRIRGARGARGSGTEGEVGKCFTTSRIVRNTRTAKELNTQRLGEHSNVRETSQRDRCHLVAAPLQGSGHLDPKNKRRLQKQTTATCTKPAALHLVH